MIKKKYFMNEAEITYKKLEDISEKIARIYYITLDKASSNMDKHNCELIEKKTIDIIKQENTCAGVWAMFGKEKNTWRCLQVAQKSSRNLRFNSIGCEIARDLRVMNLQEPSQCVRCDLKISEDRAFYKDVFVRHTCENCHCVEVQKERFALNRIIRNKRNILNLSRIHAIYKMIASKYNELAIVIIDSNGMNLSDVECDFARKHQAIYFQDVRFLKIK